MCVRAHLHHNEHVEVRGSSHVLPPPKHGTMTPIFLHFGATRCLSSKWYRVKRHGQVPFSVQQLPVILQSPSLPFPFSRLDFLGTQGHRDAEPQPEGARVPHRPAEGYVPKPTFYICKHTRCSGWLILA